MEDKYFIHSKCCMAHWELVYLPKEDKMVLQCEKCGKPAGVDVTKPAHLTPACECETCKGGKDGQKH